MSHPSHPRPVTPEENRANIQSLLLHLSHDTSWSELLAPSGIPLHNALPKPKPVISIPRIPRKRTIILTDTEISILDYLCEHTSGYARDIAAATGKSGRDIVTPLQRMVGDGWLKHYRQHPTHFLTYEITKLGREIAVMPQPQDWP